jgi:hypothetical protein
MWPRHTVSKPSMHRVSEPPQQHSPLQGTSWPRPHTITPSATATCAKLAPAQLVAGCVQADAASNHTNIPACSRQMGTKRLPPAAKRAGWPDSPQGAQLNTSTAQP